MDSNRVGARRATARRNRPSPTTFAGQAVASTTAQPEPMFDEVDHLPGSANAHALKRMTSLSHRLAIGGVHPRTSPIAEPVAAPVDVQRVRRGHEETRRSVFEPRFVAVVLRRTTSAEPSGTGRDSRPLTLLLRHSQDQAVQFSCQLDLTSQPAVLLRCTQRLEQGKLDHGIGFAGHAEPGFVDIDMASRT